MRSSSVWGTPQSYSPSVHLHALRQYVKTGTLQGKEKRVVFLTRSPKTSVTLSRCRRDVSDSCVQSTAKGTWTSPEAAASSVLFSCDGVATSCNSVEYGQAYRHTLDVQQCFKFEPSHWPFQQSLHAEVSPPVSICLVTSVSSSCYRVLVTNSPPKCDLLPRPRCPRLSLGSMVWPMCLPKSRRFTGPRWLVSRWMFTTGNGTGTMCCSAFCLAGTSTSFSNRMTAWRQGRTFKKTVDALSTTSSRGSCYVDLSCPVSARRKRNSVPSWLVGVESHCAYGYFFC